MKKRLFSILMALSMCLSLLPATALATDGLGYDENGFSTGEDSVTYQPATQVTAENYEALGLTVDYVDYYAIGNAGQLYWFAGLVNGTLAGVEQNTSANAVLTADITVNTGVLNEDGALASDTSTFKVWTPIGDTSYTALDNDDSVDASNAYAGTFDGRNHTISGLYLNADKNDCALFGMTTSDAQISNLTVADSYFGGRNRVAGVCARNNGRITNCTNRSAVSSSVKTAGGICGWNDRGTITGCTNSGTISGPKYIGGVCGYNDGTISGCTNSGNVTGTGQYTGGVCGFNASIGKTENCRNEGTVTGSQYTGGVCGYNNKVGDKIGTITGCTNSGAVTGNYTGGVCGYSNGTITNCTNTNSGTVSGKHFTGGVSGYNTGSITGCTNSGPVTGTNNTGGVCGRNYNTGTITNCTNSGTVTSTGNPNSDNYGRTAGVAGYNTGTITGCSNTGTIKATADCTGGVCGYNNSTTTSSKGTITNCTNSGAVTGTGQYTGGVCGYNADTMTNCTNTNTGTVTGTDDYTGGVCGFNASTGKIENCRNEGTVSGKNFTGGVSGYNNSINANKGTITNCTNSGDVSSSSSIVGGVCGRNYGGSITNCYFNSDAYLGNAVGSTDNNGTDTAVEGKTAAQFRSGEVAWLLNGSTSDGDLAWGQTIGRDSYPVLGGAKVYQTAPCGAAYSNISGTKEHKNVGGICADCGEVLGEISDPYVIDSQDALNAFVKAVNNGNVSLNAQLTVDGLTLTTPIGQNADGKRYTGAFDGQNHTLTVDLKGGESTAPFAAIDGTTIKNLRTTGTIQTGGKYAAGLVSNAWRTVTIENCYSDVIITSTVNGDGTHGGLVGRSNHDSDDTDGNPANITIRNCGFAGQINGADTYACGGLMGWIHQGQTLTVENCYVAGKFTVSGTSSDTICRNIEHAQVTATVTNFYYLTKLGGFGGGKATLQANCRQLTAEQFASGEAAWLLNGSTSEGVWGQTIGTDAYPVPGGATVYRLNALRCDGQVLDTYVFSNSETAVLAHTLENVAEVPATYESDGVKAHQHCTTCDKNFIDGVEQSAEDLRIPKLVMPVIPVTPTYPPTVTQPAEGGSVTVSTNNPAQGVTVTVTPKAEDGYEVGSVTVTDRNGNPVAVTDNGDGTYSFTQPAGAVKVEVQFKETVCDGGADCSSHGFADVNTSLWYHEAIDYVTENGIMNGVGDGKFDPNGNLSRSMLMTMLARLDGVDTDGGAIWYEKGLNWAVETGISDGTNPGGDISRQEVATMLYRYAQLKGYDTSARADLSAFTDGDQTASWAEEAMEWAVQSGMLQGDDNRALNPKGSATRAEIAQIFMNFMKNIVK